MTAETLTHPGHTSGPTELGPRRIDPVATKAKNFAAMSVVAGLAIACLSLIVPKFAERFWASYLVSYTFFLSLTLGALFFVIIQHVVRAGWSVVVRRVAEGLAMNMMLMVVLYIPAAWAIATGKIHAWAAHGDHGAVAGHGAEPGAPEHGGGEHGAPAPFHGGAPVAPGEGRGPSPVAEASKPGTPPQAITQALGRGAPFVEAHAPMQHSKAVWLSREFFLGRTFGYLLLWIFLARFFRGLSVAQDASGDPALTSRMQWWAPPALLAYALTTALCAFDLLMSIDPHWYSTMYGVYIFAGSLVGFFATLIITLVALQRQGLLREVTPEHYHDVGKFMFAFTVFWAYVAYSQFMLIWYGNIPEEVVWFQRRIDRDWIWVSAALIVGHFFVPFLALLSRFGKRRPELLAYGAAWLLVMHYVDLMWNVLPEPGKDRAAPVPLLDLGLALGLGGLYVWSTVHNLGGASLIPERDPRLADSLAHENF